jgi:surface polysaccharide O-acyltransferase-like enzyme
MRRMDALRVAAVLGVAVMHAAGSLAVPQRDPSSAGWWAWILADSAVLWCVPVFVMLSGAVLLGNESGEDWRAFYRRRARRLLAPLVWWTAAYSALRWKMGHEANSLGDVLLAIAHGTPYPHMWFLYMLAALALFTPMLRTYVRAASPSERHVLLGVLLAVTTGNSLLTRLHSPVAQTALNQFAPFLVYYLCGYELRRADLRRLHPAGVVLAVAAAYFAVVAMPFALLRLAPSFDGVFFLSCYQSPAVMIMAIGLFTLLCRAESSARPPPGWVVWVGARLSPAVFGIYLVHPLVLKAVRMAGGDAMALPAALKIPALALATFAVSAAVVLGMLRIPCVRRLVS